eukprot:SAG11_NODE_906_length_6600_cov_8.505461_4_plen_48_part_00
MYIGKYLVMDPYTGRTAIIARVLGISIIIKVSHTLWYNIQPTYSTYN